MPKLKLDLDALRVDSFGTTAAAAGRGTVLGENGAVPVVFGRSDPLPQDTGCTAPCMSGDSECPIESCGSGCDTDAWAVFNQPAALTN
jgi:hypothetical protein